MEINLAIAGRARAGMALTAAEIDELATADVLSLGMLADDVRRARVGDRVTFVRVHEWKPGEEVPHAAREVRLGVLPDTLEVAMAQIRAARAAAGNRRVTGFSLASVIDRARSGWGAALEILEHLKEAGLDAIVHAPVDALPDASAALGASRDAGLAIGCLSVQRPIDDRPDRPVDPDADASPRSSPRSRPSRRCRASSRRWCRRRATTMCGWSRWRDWSISTVPHIQVDWSQYGPKLAQVALTFGADDLDRVSAVDDERIGRRRMAAEDVKRNIAAAGLRGDRAGSAGMRRLRLGAVSYLNTKPLVYGLEAHRDLFSVRYDVPSQCAALLHQGHVDLGLIPSIEYLRGDYAMVPDVAIGSNGPIASVAIFTRVPIDQIRTLALDTSSRTSVALTKDPVREAMADRTDAGSVQARHHRHACQGRRRPAHRRSGAGVES